MNYRIMSIGAMAIAIILMAVANGAAFQPPTRKNPADRSKRAARPSTSRPSAPKGTSALQKKFREAMSAGDVDRAARLLGAARKTLAAPKSVATEEDRDRWYLFEAELELAKGRAAKAGLAAMRVVVQHSGSEQAGEALFWTARAYEELKRPKLSAELYRECLEDKRLPSSIRTSAEARLAALDRSVPSP